MKWVGAVLTLLAALAAGCGDPYAKRQGEYYAGPVDPVNFPPEYLGFGGNRLRAGSGLFFGSGAWASAGVRTEYFLFSFTPAQLALADIFRLVDDGRTNQSTTVPTSIAYVFDAMGGEPFPSAPACDAPPNYIYDRRQDAVRYSEQGNIFTALPSASYAGGAAVSTYVPIVSEVPATSLHQDCQGIKSERTLLQRADVALPSQGSAGGRFLAWALIDPGAAVYHEGGAPTTTGDARTGNPPGGAALQRFGWFNHYLVAYLDGGHIPTLADASGKVVQMVAQDIYYPRSLVIHPGSLGTTPGRLGRGYDLLQHKRGEFGYSPVCRVLTYDAGAPSTSANLPHSVAEMNARYGSTVAPPEQPPAPATAIPNFIYCFQIL